MPRTRAHAGLAHVLKDWGFFALAALPGALESLLGLGMVAKELSTTAFGEWVVLLATITVVGAASQLGMKTAYMQVVVDLAGLARQRQSLRAGIVFLSATGFLAGLLVAAGLGLLAFFGVWDSVAVLGLLPLTMALTNAQMLLVTDLRIRRRLQWLTVMSVIQLPVFAAVLFGLRALGVGGLFLIMASSAVVSGARLAILWWIISPGHPLRARWGFIGPALTLGIPIMLGLLIKYASDATVHMTLLWFGPQDLVGDWGRAQRALEPFNSLYLLALLMAWGPNAILMAGARSGTEVARLRHGANRVLGLCALGLPLGWLWVEAATRWLDGLSMSADLGPWVVLAVLSRMMAFCAISVANFGMVIAREYGRMVWVYAVEWLLSIALVSGVLVFGDGSALAIGFVVLMMGAIPWLAVAWCYGYLSPLLVGLHASRTMVSS